MPDKSGLFSRTESCSFVSACAVSKTGSCGVLHPLLAIAAILGCAFLRYGLRYCMANCSKARRLKSFRDETGKNRFSSASISSVSNANGVLPVFDSLLRSSSFVTGRLCAIAAVSPQTLTETRPYDTVNSDGLPVFMRILPRSLTLGSFCAGSCGISHDLCAEFCMASISGPFHCKKYPSVNPLRLPNAESSLRSSSSTL